MYATAYLGADVNLSEPHSDTHKKRKRALGKGGAAAHYCTMSVASRMAQFLEEPSEECLGSLNQSSCGVWPVENLYPTGPGPV